MPGGSLSNAIRSTRRFRKFRSLFNPRLLALIKSLVPSGLYKRLDPFEASIETFVRGVAAEIPRGKRVLDAGAGEGRLKSLSALSDSAGSILRTATRPGITRAST